MHFESRTSELWLFMNNLALLMVKRIATHEIFIFFWKCLFFENSKFNQKCRKQAHLRNFWIGLLLKSIVAQQFVHLVWPFKKIDQANHKKSAFCSIKKIFWLYLAYLTILDNFGFDWMNECLEANYANSGLFEIESRCLATAMKQKSFVFEFETIYRKFNSNAKIFDTNSNGIKIKQLISTIDLDKIKDHKKRLPVIKWPNLSDFNGCRQKRD